MKKFSIASLILFFVMVSPLAAQTVAAPAAVDSHAAALRQLALPGVNHYILDRLAGTWKITGEAWLEGFDKKSAKVTGQARHGTRFNSRFLSMDDSLNIRNAIYESAALLGYDNAHKHYIMSRASSQSTALVHYTGTADSSSKRLTLESSPADSLAGTYARITIRFINGNKFVVETWDIYPNGTALKQRELIYTRLS